MGKTNKKRGHSRGNKGQVAASPVTNEVIDDQEENRTGKTDYLDGFLDSICIASDDGQKECILATLANLAQEKEAILKMQEKGIVKKLGFLIADSNPQIKEKIAGTFRNMTVAGGAEACEYMVKSDILICIGYSIKKDITELNQLIKCGNIGETTEKLSASLKELVLLLWNLCESSSLAVKLVNDDKLVVPLASIIAAENLDADLVIASAQCLYTVTEDNKEAISQLINEASLLERFAQIIQGPKIDGKQLLLASLLSGIIYSLHNSLPENVWGQLMHPILTNISAALESKSSDILLNISNNEHKIEELLSYFSAQQVCLELLTNLLCSNDDQEWEDMEVLDDSDADNNTEEMQANMDVESAMKDYQELPIFKLLIEKSLPSKILSFIETPNKDSFSTMKDTALAERVLSASLRLQKTALICFNNLLTECPIDVIGDANCLGTVWAKVINLGTEQNGSLTAADSEDLVDGLTGLLRGIAVKMSEMNDCQFLTPQSMEIFEAWYKRLTVDSAKCNLLSILGIGGKLIALKENALPVLEAIGRVLCSAVKIGNSIVVIAEALDAVFDAFAENGVPDSVLLSSGLAKELCHLPPLLNARIKAERHKLKEHLPVIDMSRTNLIRFIKYKQLK